MPKFFKITLVVASLVALVVCAAFMIFVQSLKPDIPEPESDVDIEYKIGWWAHQEGLEVKGLETSVLFGGLNLFNSTALVQYTVVGTAKNDKGWRPYIDKVFLSERWTVSPENFKGNQADIELVPIVGVRHDEGYNGEPIDFRVKVQDYLKPGGWGENVYDVRCQSQTSRIELHQRK